MYKYFLFDWDGTLARTLDIWLETLRAALIKRNYNLSDLEIGANYELFRVRFESKQHLSADDIIREALIEADERIPRVELYDFAVETLKLIHGSGSKLALVTTSPHSQIDPLLEKYELEALFDAVVCSDDTQRQKPDPEPIIKAMQILRASKSDTILIGDSEKDINAAHNAGIDSMLFYPEIHEKFHDFQMLKSLKPTYIVRSLHEVNKVI